MRKSFSPRGNRIVVEYNGGGGVQGMLTIVGGTILTWRFCWRYVCWFREEFLEISGRKWRLGEGINERSDYVEEKIVLRDLYGSGLIGECYRQIVVCL